MKEFLENQRKNLFLWSPFIVAFGGALYFSLHSEPGFQFPILITVLLGLIIYKHKSIILTAVALFLFGFFYTMSFSQIINTPQINTLSKSYNISGIIKDLDFSNESTRVLIKIPANQINAKLPLNNYTNVRITLGNNQDIPNINDKISGNAILFHPSPAYAPDSFDFARWAYFTHLSGTGFFKDYDISLQNHYIINTRVNIHNKANSVLTDALVLGYKKTIPKSELNIWQSIGIGHVWSISGFHIALVGGWLFTLFYLLFRCISPLTKRIPAKYPAIICTWLGLLCYIGISGFGVATLRAFLMTTLICIACIFNRNILSLRNAAMIFLLIFLINPFYVMHAGFQLSFAAVFGLLWLFDNKEYHKRNLFKRIWHTICITLLIAIVAGIFTLPFVIAHFGYIPVYTVIGNIIILPIFSLLIMPLVIIGTVFALCGNHYILDITNNIYNFALNIAKNIANFPYANITIDSMSNTVLILSVIGLLCIILIVKPKSENYFKRNINYVIGFVFIICAVFIQTNQDRPLFYSTYDNELVGFVENDKLHFNKSKSSKHFFAFPSWQTLNNEQPSDKINRKKCNKGLCVYNTSNWKLVYMQTIKTVLDNINEACRDKSIDFIVTPTEIKAPKCHAKILNGGLVIYPSGKITKISNHRLWHKYL